MYSSPAELRMIYDLCLICIHVVHLQQALFVCVCTKTISLVYTYIEEDRNEVPSIQYKVLPSIPLQLKFIHSWFNIKCYIKLLIVSVSVECGLSELKLLLTIDDLLILSCAHALKLIFGKCGTKEKK